MNRFISTPSAAQVQFSQAISKLPEDWRESPRNIVLPGYDGITGTDDDFIARCRQGRLDSYEIPGRALYFSAAEKIERASAEKFPTREQGNLLLQGIEDPWGNAMRYDLIDSSHIRISSKGPGEKEKSEWSQGLVIEKTAGQAVAPKDTWLARRKAELGIREKPSPGGFRRTEFSGGESKLEGAAYFRFFTWLILAALVVYLPFSLIYRPKTYLHETEGSRSP